MTTTTLSTLHYHAGWNMAGCAPETPYRVFANAEQAIEYLTGEIDQSEGCACPENPNAEALESCEACFVKDCLTGALADGSVAYGVGLSLEMFMYCVHVCVETHSED